MLNHSYTDEMQTLKDMMKTKDSELQRLLSEQEKREGEFGIESVCAWPKLTSLVLLYVMYPLAHPTCISTSTITLPTSPTLYTGHTSLFHFIIHIHLYNPGADLGGALGAAAPPLNPSVKTNAKYNNCTVLITRKKLSPIHDSCQ